LLPFFLAGTVLKRFDPAKLYSLACQDAVERAHLLATLAFVIVEEMADAGRSSPSPRLLGQCAAVFLAEIAIDVAKHAVLGKFNEIRPGVYREFMRDLCEGAASAQSHGAHRLVGLEPFAPTALLFRAGTTLAVLRWGNGAAAPGVAAAVAAWVGLFALKTGVGYAVRLSAKWYLRRYDARRARTVSAAQRRAAGASPKAAAALGGPVTFPLLAQQRKAE
jgi:hypothetical protein